MRNDLLDIPKKKKYDLSEVEFLDYVAAHSQGERPLFSVQDIARLAEMAGAAPKTLEERIENREHFKLMPHTNIKDLLAGIWAKRDKAFAEEKAA